MKNIIARYNQFLDNNSIQKLLASGGEVHVASENQSVEKIELLLKIGQKYFAEKYTQEMIYKWSDSRLIQYPFFLSFFGHIQSNKINKIINISNSIEGISNIKTAKKIANLQLELGFRRRYLLQVNISREPQKNGCLPEDASYLLDQIRNEIELEISGVMIIPRKGVDPSSDFNWARKFADENNLFHCAMGMSSDYQVAIKCGATIIRVGRIIWNED